MNMKTTKQLKDELYLLDGEYIAQMISALEYSAKAAELIEKIQASEKLDVLAKVWQDDRERMLSNI